MPARFASLRYDRVDSYLFSVARWLIWEVRSKALPTKTESLDVRSHLQSQRAFVVDQKRGKIALSAISRPDIASANLTNAATLNAPRSRALLPTIAIRSRQRT